MAWPDAEVPIDEQLVRDLLVQQHPDLADLPLVLVDAGWDNSMWRLGADLAVRMPRRALSAPLIVKEQQWLPSIAAGLPLAVPVPLRVGRPSLGYPWSWSVVPWLEGQAGDRVAVVDGAGSAGRLGAFLRALHRDAPADAPYNEYRSGPLSGRVDTFEERMAELADHVDESALRRVWEAALQADPQPGPPKWIHGDMHPANTLISDGILVGIIDFGDMCSGDPATDIAALTMLLPPDSAAPFWAAYGAYDPALELRSLGWAVLFGLMLLDIGLRDRRTYETVGRAALQRVVMR